MNDKTEYVDVVKEVKVSLNKRTLNAISNGVCKWRILVDPEPECFEKCPGDEEAKEVLKTLVEE